MLDVNMSFAHGSEAVLMPLVKAGMSNAVLLIPLEDGRCVVAHGVNGTFHPEHDVFANWSLAADAAVARMRGRAGHRKPRGLGKSRAETGR
jgi:hypothetical protein